MADDPGAAFTSAAQKDDAAVAGYYRMIEHPAESEVNRKHDGPAGHKKIWGGYIRLAVKARAYERLLRMDRTSLLYQRLCPDKSCS